MVLIVYSQLRDWRKKSLVCPFPLLCEAKLFWIVVSKKKCHLPALEQCYKTFFHLFFLLGKRLHSVSTKPLRFLFPCLLSQYFHMGKEKERREFGWGECDQHGVTAGQIGWPQHVAVICSCSQERKQEPQGKWLRTRMFFQIWPATLFRNRHVPGVGSLESAVPWAPFLAGSTHGLPQPIILQVRPHYSMRLWAFVEEKFTVISDTQDAEAGAQPSRRPVWAICPRLKIKF